MRESAEEIEVHDTAPDPEARSVCLGDILVTIVIGGGTIAWALHSPQSDIVLLAAVTWLFLAAAWTLTLTVNRGIWSPSSLDTASFVELSVRRCRGRLAAVGLEPFSSCATFCLAWVYNHSPEMHGPLWRWLFFSSVPIDIVWLATLAFAGFLVWRRRRKRPDPLRSQTRAPEHGGAS